MSSEDIEEAKKCRVDGSQSHCNTSVPDDGDSDADEDGADDDDAKVLSRKLGMDSRTEKSSSTTHEVFLICRNLKKC